MSWLSRLKRPKLDVHEEKCISDIRDHGCHILLISSDENDPQYAFSVGFPVSVGQPEVIIFGLRFEVMQSMINELRDQCQAGLVMRDGLPVQGLIDGFDCVLRHITDKRMFKQHFGWAIWYHRTQQGVALREAFQIVWPGKLDGLYPWQDGCDELVITSQPALYDRLAA